MAASRRLAPVSKNRDIRLALPFHLIQALRLSHAIMESDFVVHIASREKDKFCYLERFFNLRYVVDTADVPVLAGVTLSHAEPETRIGEIKRPLIFPAGIVQRCRNLWPNERTLRFSFRGLLTPERRTVLENWMISTIGNRAATPNWNAPIYDETLKLEVQVSEIGRHFPEKVWDDSYYRSLAASKFVLCPSGDCTWSYRFFESVLCGAIPIAEQPCAAYEGFEYHLMNEDAKALQWSEQIAEHNFAHAVKRLTVPRDEMQMALENELSRAGRGCDANADDRNPWYQMLVAATEIAAVVPEKQSFILVDQDAWREALSESNRVGRPFLERDGYFAGLPADDETARRELERMRSEGAALIVFAQPCFWMLDYYARFAAYLRQSFHCVLENRRLIAFDLRSEK